ncbi:MAG: rhomboid family intramembrane serine protease [Bradymonadaceae bacterium]
MRRRSTGLGLPPFSENVQIGVLALAVFWLAAIQFDDFVREYLIVSGDQVFENLYVWTIVTYAFWHWTFQHLLFNGIALWMFGGFLDRRWSTRKFWRFSLICAAGGGVTIALWQWLTGTSIPTLGYSGAVMGLVAAFAWYNWDRTIQFFFFPMTGKMLLIFFIVIDFARVIGAHEPISISGHIGGMVTGLLLVSGLWRPRKIKRKIEQYRRRRKFQNETRPPDGGLGG